MTPFYPRPLRLLDHPRAALIATLVIGLALACAAAFWQQADNVRTAQLRFDSVAEDATEQLAIRLRAYEPKSSS